MAISAIAPEVLQHILSEYGIPADSATTLLNLDDGDHHHDPAWRVDTGGDPMVLRLIAEREWSWLGHQWYSDELLSAQLRFVDHLQQRRIPFPARRVPSGGEWVVAHGADTRYRAVGFEWLPADAGIETPTEAIAHGAGRLLASLHGAATDFTRTEGLGTESLLGWARQVADELSALTVGMPATIGRIMSRHVDDIRRQVDSVGELSCRLAGHGDLNVPNVLIRRGAVVGAVDIGRIALIDPTEELANVVRWFSERKIDGKRVPEPALAAAVVAGYRSTSAGQAISAPLPELTWLSAATAPHLFFPVRKALAAGTAVDEDWLAARIDARRTEADRLRDITRALTRGRA
ncbi:phosphotransferase enzyme family protein [Nocardia wallacei]|uniref:phosphotransferase enzyme family protein n=1 Tax=Nocardia wallacei TaxID=480035 RepID=UPI002453E3CA|nr:phosphotransferase [Nocardia wallacei]